MKIPVCLDCRKTNATEDAATHSVFTRTITLSVDNDSTDIIELGRLNKTKFSLFGSY